MDTRPLLRPDSPSSTSVSFSSSLPPISARRVLLRLYISHFLSTWNSLMFEFGAVVFLAYIFPGTLLYTSVYALMRSLSAVILSSWLGSVVDRLDRLTAIRHSIIWQRIPVVISCACFAVLLASPPARHLSWILFIALNLLSGVEKLAATANRVSVERDWAIVIANELQIPRHADLPPVVVSFMDDVFSTEVAIWTVMGMNAVSVFVEYFAIAQVYRSVPQLDRIPENRLAQDEDEDENVEDESSVEKRPLFHKISQSMKSTFAPWQEYVRQPVFAPSFTLSLLYLSVLGFGPTMATFLLHSGFRPLDVSAVGIGVVLAELLGTWAAPFLMDRIGPIRSGLWFLNWQFGSLASTVAAFALAREYPQLVAGCLIVGVTLSRTGLWGFDLSVQYIVQDVIEARSRARFSATEMALQSIFEMLSFATTIVFPDPEQFEYPVYISYGTIAIAAVYYAVYARQERGHLFHPLRCLGQTNDGLVPRV